MTPRRRDASLRPGAATRQASKAKDVDTGCLIPGPVAVLPQPPPLPAQPARRAPGQEPAGADDRPGPSALADPTGSGTASAPAGLTTGRPTTSRTGHPSSQNPALTGRRSSYARVTQKWQILNHAPRASFPVCAGPRRGTITTSRVFIWPATRKRVRGARGTTGPTMAPRCGAWSDWRCGRGRAWISAAIGSGRTKRRRLGLDQLPAQIAPPVLLGLHDAPAAQTAQA